MLRMMATAQWQFLRGRDRSAVDTFFEFVCVRRSGGSAWDDATDLRQLSLGNASAVKVELRPNRYAATLDHLSMRTLGTCGVPVTFLLGGDSNPMFHRDHRRLAAVLPSMRTVEVPGASHMFPYDDPDPVVVAVRSVG